MHTLPFQCSRLFSRSLAAAVLALGGLAGCGNPDTATSDAANADSANIDSASTDPAAGGDAAAGEVVVFAAASLTEAFTELGAAFTAANPEANVTLNFAGSSNLAAQIIEGAPADVYASADLNNMNKVIAADANAAEPVIFANNLSAIIVAPGNPLGIEGVADLARDDLIVVTCAPEVPCGSYATEIFDKAGITVTPDSYEENVKSVVTKVTLGEADAGISYATDVTAAGDKADGVEIPDSLNVVAQYPIVVTNQATNESGAQAFIDFVVSDAGQEILTSYGFSSP